MTQIRRITQRTNALSQPIGPPLRGADLRAGLRLAGAFFAGAFLAAPDALPEVRLSATSGRFRLGESLILLLARPLFFYDSILPAADCLAQTLCGHVNFTPNF
jgi:energy-converting hydrogenase Eha subunit B|tara:strand:- start:1807 stop:2115 length:309 start_codon:yes stop_codon:yes gene_type:complete